jgi:hypothetical protein
MDVIDKMILMLFVFLVCLCVGMLIFGFVSKHKYARYIAYVLLVVVGLASLSGLDYKVGNQVNSTFHYSGTTVVGTSDDMIYTYASYPFHDFAFGLVALASLALIIDLIGLWEKGDSYGQDYD